MPHAPPWILSSLSGHIIRVRGTFGKQRNTISTIEPTDCNPMSSITERRESADEFGAEPGSATRHALKHHRETTQERGVIAMLLCQIGMCGQRE
jgi:hypothetical protein